MSLPLALDVASAKPAGKRPYFLEQEVERVIVDRRLAPPLVHFDPADDRPGGDRFFFDSVHVKKHEAVSGA